MKYEFLDCELIYDNIGKGGPYHFCLSDNSSDYSRILKHFKNGVFAISGCRSGFEKDTISGIVSQLNMFNVPYNEKELQELDDEDCDKNGKMYKRLLKRYNAYTTKQLETDLRSMGYGFRPSIGGYRENISTVSSKEMSFLVPYMKNKTPEEFLKDATSLCNKYIQDSVLFVHPYFEDGKAMWVNKNSNVDRFMKSAKPRMSGDSDWFTETKRTNSEGFSLDPVFEEEFESEEGDIYTYEVEDLDQPIKKTLKDSGIPLKRIIDEIAKYHLVPSSQRDYLNTIYKDGWTRRG